MICRQSLASQGQVRSRVRVVTDTVPLGQIFLPVRLIPSVSVTLPMLRNYLHLNTALIRRTSGQSLGSISEGNAVRHFGEQMAESYFHIFSLLRTVFIHVSQILFIEASSKTELNQDTGVYLGVSNFVILLICLL